MPGLNVRLNSMSRCTGCSCNSDLLKLTCTCCCLEISKSCKSTWHLVLFYTDDLVIQEARTSFQFLSLSCVYSFMPQAFLSKQQMSRSMTKPAFCNVKTKMQICTADQHLCFRYTDGTIPLLSKSKILRF